MQCLLHNRQKQRLIVGERIPVLADLSQLTNLMFIAFKDSIDEDQVDILHPATEVKKLFAGEYGIFLSSCSRVVEVGEEIVSATLLTLWKGNPLVAFIMTCPTYQHKGFARQCLINIMSDLFDSGYIYLNLVVSAKNIRAVTLYRSLGFRNCITDY